METRSSVVCGTAAEEAGGNVRASGSHIWFVLTLTLSMRVLYSGMAASLAPLLYLDPKLVAENFRTETAFQPSDGLWYPLLGVWQRFDTHWYLHIANHGYENPASVVFYPLYPLLIRLQAETGIPPLLAALLAASVATFFLFWGLSRLLSLDLSRTVVRHSLILCSLWPTAFIFFAGYADSLVMALLIWAVYFGRTGQWKWAGTLGLLAALSKAVGLLSVVPLAVLAWQRKSRSALWIGLPLLGPAIYLSALWLYGRPWPSEAYPSHWGTEFGWPWRTLWDSLHHAFFQGHPALAINISIFLLTFALAFSKTLRREYVVYVAAAFVVLLSKQSVASPSWDRYALIAFPAYPNLARLIEDRAVFAAVAVVFCLVNVFLMRAFLEWSAMV